MSCSLCDKPVCALGLCHGHYRKYRSYGDPSISKRPQGTLEERFWTKVKKGAAEECWQWQGGKTSKGYGNIQEGGRRSKHVLAHRLSYSLAKGEIPDGMNVLHSCDNPSCVNPSHLRAGTQSENIKEAFAKGRKHSPMKGKILEKKFYGPEASLPGEKNPNARLTDDDIRAIRASTEKPGVVAKRFDIIPDYVTMIRKRKVWKHVD